MFRLRQWGVLAFIFCCVTGTIQAQQENQTPTLAVRFHAYWPFAKQQAGGNAPINLYFVKVWRAAERACESWVKVLAFFRSHHPCS
jgi:hypothetical protein